MKLEKYVFLHCKIIDYILYEEQPIHNKRIHIYRIFL